MSRTSSEPALERDLSERDELDLLEPTKLDTTEYGEGDTQVLVGQLEHFRDLSEGGGAMEVAGVLTSIALGFALSFAVVLQALPIALSAGVLSFFAGLASGRAHTNQL